MFKAHGKSHSYAYRQRRSKVFVCEECGFTAEQQDEYAMHLRLCHPHSPSFIHHSSTQWTSALLDSARDAGSGEVDGDEKGSEKRSYTYWTRPNDSEDFIHRAESRALMVDGIDGVDQTRALEEFIRREEWHGPIRLRPTDLARRAMAQLVPIGAVGQRNEESLRNKIRRILSATKPPKRRLGRHGARWPGQSSGAVLSPAAAGVGACIRVQPLSGPAATGADRNADSPL